MTTVRAVHYTRFGDPTVLSFRDIVVADPGAHEVEVAVSYVGINPADSKRRSGHQSGVELPSGIGREFSGTLTRVGSGVEGFVVGDAVIGTGEGVLQEKVVVSTDAVCHLPLGLSPIMGACLVVAPQTAWRAVASQPIGPGTVVLVTAAAGGVGSVAAQLAVRLGATVLGTASASNHELLRSWGVHPIDYRQDLAVALTSAAPGGIDVVLDHEGEESIRVALALGVPPHRINSVSGAGAAFKTATVGRVGIDGDIIQKLAGLVLENALEVRIGKVFDWEHVVDAYELLDTRHFGGKIVVRLPGAPR